MSSPDEFLDGIVDTLMDPVPMGLVLILSVAYFAFMAVYGDRK
jgi:hypothetical protein